MATYSKLRTKSATGTPEEVFIAFMKNLLTAYQDPLSVFRVDRKGITKWKTCRVGLMIESTISGNLLMYHELTTRFVQPATATPGKVFWTENLVPDRPLLRTRPPREDPSRAQHLCEKIYKSLDLS